MPIKNIYSEISSFGNIMQAEKDVRAGNRYGREELKFWGNLEDNLHCLTDAVSRLDFPPDTYHTFYVYEPKLRRITCSDYRTKVIQRAAYNVINPLVCRGFITDTYSCVKGRGQIAAMKRLAGWVDALPGWYYLKMDVEKFFYRIDHEILMKIIRKKISDAKAVRLMEHYVCEASRPFGLPQGVKNPMDIDEKDMLWDVGITIGGGLSHMHGNMYLDPLDQLMKRTLGVKYYIRYMDDIVILSEDKAALHRDRREAEEYLDGELKLRPNKKTAVRPVADGIEFVGFYIRPGEVRLRNGTSLRMRRNLKKKQEEYKTGGASAADVRATIMSYHALMRHCDCGALERAVLDNLILCRGRLYGHTDCACGTRRVQKED